MKPYHAISIQDCGEPLLPIPADRFVLTQPHAYEQVGAPYGDRSPYWIRAGVLTALLRAQTQLETQYPGWRMQIFDAYRPLAVQQYMVDYTFTQQVTQQGLQIDRLTSAQRQSILEQVYQFWAVPSSNPHTPPPHSTGAAVDVTLRDALGEEVAMGSPIDELSPRSYPDYFASLLTEQKAFLSEGDRALFTQFHTHRQILQQVMTHAGFHQHPHEWWHFSLGDQLWAWLEHLSTGGVVQAARYGAANWNITLDNTENECRGAGD